MTGQYVVSVWGWDRIGGDDWHNYWNSDFRRWRAQRKITPKHDCRVNLHLAADEDERYEVTLKVTVDRDCASLFLHNITVNVDGSDPTSDVELDLATLTVIVLDVVALARPLRKNDYETWTYELEAGRIVSVLEGVPRERHEGFFEKRFREWFGRPMADHLGDGWEADYELLEREERARRVAAGPLPLLVARHLLEAEQPQTVREIRDGIGSLWWRTPIESTLRRYRGKVFERAGSRVDELGAREALWRMRHDVQAAARTADDPDRHLRDVLRTFGARLKAAA